jgi:RNA polymerase sigma factor (sigma-70 family)
VSIYLNTSERDAAILSLKSRVEFTARDFARRLPPSVQYQELVSAGWSGAIAAVDHFDPARGFTLGTFSKMRIRGAILDYLRGIDPLSRADRLVERRDPGSVPIRVVSLSADSGRAAGLSEIVPDPRCTRDQEQLDARLDVEKLLLRANLKPRTLGVLRRLMGGELGASVALSLGVNQSRISHIYLGALRKLRDAA